MVRLLISPRLNFGMSDQEDDWMRLVTFASHSCQPSDRMKGANLIGSWESVLAEEDRHFIIQTQLAMEHSWRRYFPSELTIPDVNEENEPTWQILIIREFKRIPLTTKQDRALVELCHQNGVRNVEAWIGCMVKKMIVTDYKPQPGQENESFWFESDEEEASEQVG